MLSVSGRVSPDLARVYRPLIMQTMCLSVIFSDRDRDPSISFFSQPDIEGFLTLSTFSGLVCAGGGILSDLFGDQVADESLEKFLTRVLSFVVMQPACVDIQ